MKESFLELIIILMKRMNKMLLVAALAATTLSVQAEQKKGPAWLTIFLYGYFYMILITNKQPKRADHYWFINMESAL